MTDEEIIGLVSKFEDYSSDREVRFGYYDEFHEKKIKANKAGLILAASIFLKAASEYDNSEQNILTIEDHWIDENATHYFDYIEKTDHFEDFNPPVETLKDSLFQVGCFALVICFLICTVIGVINIIDWLFFS